MMNRILSDIYRGKYTVIQKHTRKGTPFARLLEQSNELEELIRKSLSDTLKDTFDQYIKVGAGLSFLACEEDFIAGYQLGTCLMLAAQEDCPDRLIPDMME